MPGAASTSPARKAWLRALELTAPIAGNRQRTISAVIGELAERSGGAVALLADRETFTYSQLAERANRYARWALDQGLAKGEVVGLLMTNRPEYLAVWLGITSVGCIVALINTNLSGKSLAHCVDLACPRHFIASSEFIDAAAAILPHITTRPTIWVHGPSKSSFPRIDLDLERYSGGSLGAGERRPTAIEDKALYIYTSGTTGLPKAANVSHARIMQWSYWFAGMMGMGPADRMYNCLPMYHSVGGVLVPGATLAGGGSVFIREKFSASRFWSDIIRWDCTLFQYIGELCRYLLHCERSPLEREHRIRMACGNGLSAEVWEEFKGRFGIPRIFEFYAATEGGVSLFNVEGKCGAIGHIPAYLQHRFSPALARFDVDKGELARNDRGLCIPCGRNEAGEALGRVQDGASNVGSRFEGYTSEAASTQRFVRNVFEPGDLWVRTGDLMRRDEQGYFYFVDRIGDTFRWKGENVATSEVSETVAAFPGVRHANVYGVTVPGADGRAGMAAVVTEYELNLPAFRKRLSDRLPHYARPLFLRIQNEVDLTSTFKYSKSDLVRQGFDPRATTEIIYFNNPETETFVRLDLELHERIRLGEIRL